MIREILVVKEKFVLLSQKKWNDDYIKEKKRRKEKKIEVWKKNYNNTWSTKTKRERDLKKVIIKILAANIV